MKLKKLVVSGVAALALSPVVATLGNGFFTTQVVQAKTVKPSDNGENVTYISNREIFNILEKQGYNVKSILGEKEYDIALTQDLLRAGGTYIKTNKNGFTVYVNSAICKAAVWGGAAGVSVALSAALASAGVGGAAAAVIPKVVASVISGAGRKATERGIYVKVSKKGNLISWVANRIWHTINSLLKKKDG